MATIRCPNGHDFDPSRHMNGTMLLSHAPDPEGPRISEARGLAKCPTCAAMMYLSSDDQRWRPLNPDAYCPHCKAPRCRAIDQALGNSPPAP